MKKIGFLSFGHWTPSPQSQTRSASDALLQSIDLAVATEELGADAIIGAHCGSSRHEGMNAGEAGADYVSFGPVGASVLGNGEIAEAELFDWWSQMIELPVVAEGGLTPALVRALAPMTDFFAIGDEIWSASDPASELAALKAAMAG